MTVRDRVNDALLRLQNVKPDSVAVLADQTAFESIATAIAGRAQYDWSSLSSELFPTGNVSDFDVTNADALAQWSKLRADHHGIISEALREYLDTGYQNDEDFTLAVTGISLDVPRGTIERYEPVRFDRDFIVDTFKSIGVIYRGDAQFRVNSSDEINTDHYRLLFIQNKNRVSARMRAISEAMASAHSDYLSTYNYIPESVTDIGVYLRALAHMKSALSNMPLIYARADEIMARAGLTVAPTVAPAPKGKPLHEILADRVREAQRKQDPSTALDAFNNFGILGRRANNANASRTWGIELEVTDAGGVPTPAGWLKERDGSLRPMIGDGRLYDPWEFVSPILRKTYDPGLRELCSYIENSVQYVRAGVHVHVSATDVKGNRMTTYQVSRLIEIYAIISRLLDPVIQRDERDFCVPTRTEDWAHGWFRRDYPNKYRPGSQRGRATGMHPDAYENAKLHAQMTNSADPNNEPTSWKRYQEVNLQSLNKHGTIEFRSMGPVYRFEYLSRWAWFLRELVNIAADESISTKAVYRFTTLDEVMTWVTMHAVEKLGTPKAKKATTTKRRAPKALQSV